MRDDYPGGWFGPSWGAPVCEPATHLPTPVGQECMFRCGKLIVDGDAGMVIPGGDAEGQFRLYAAHRDCFLRDLGLPDH